MEHVRCFFFPFFLCFSLFAWSVHQRRSFLREIALVFDPYVSAQRAGGVLGESRAHHWERDAAIGVVDSIGCSRPLPLCDRMRVEGSSAPFIVEFMCMHRPTYTCRRRVTMDGDAVSQPASLPLRRPQRSDESCAALTCRCFCCTPQPQPFDSLQTRPHVTPFLPSMQQPAAQSYIRPPARNPQLCNFAVQMTNPRVAGVRLHSESFEPLLQWMPWIQWGTNSRAPSEPNCVILRRCSCADGSLLLPL